jgi:hypothetical protein
VLDADQLAVELKKLRLALNEEKKQREEERKQLRLHQDRLELKVEHMSRTVTPAYAIGQHFLSREDVCLIDPNIASSLADLPRHFQSLLPRISSLTDLMSEITVTSDEVDPDDDTSNNTAAQQRSRETEKKVQAAVMQLMGVCLDKKHGATLRAHDASVREYLTDPLAKIDVILFPHLSPAKHVLWSQVASVGEVKPNLNSTPMYHGAVGQVFILSPLSCAFPSYSEFCWLSIGDREGRATVSAAACAFVRLLLRHRTRII